MTKYKAHLYYFDVEHVTVARETKMSLWVEYSPGKFRREARRTSTTRFFDTFEDARAFLLEVINSKIEQSKKEISCYEDQRRNVETMAAPEPGVSVWVRRIKYDKI